MRRRNKKKIDAKYAEKKALLNEFYDKQRAFRQFSFANKRQKAAGYALQRREEEIREAEEIKKEEEEALKRHPFEKEMGICDVVLSYLKSLEQGEKKEKKEEQEGQKGEKEREEGELRALARDLGVVRHHPRERAQDCRGRGQVHRGGEGEKGVLQRSASWRGCCCRACQAELSGVG